MTDSEGLIKFLSEINPQLPQLSAVQNLPVPAASPTVAEDNLEWAADNVAGKWNKIRSAVMNAKTAWEVSADVSAMSVREWLDWCVKMAPKQVEVQAMQISTVRIELPSRSGLDDGNVVEIELPR